jgi:hypothetical protein
MLLPNSTAHFYFDEGGGDHPDNFAPVRSHQHLAIDFPAPV